MSLNLPTVGVTAGPTYATQVNTAFEDVDAHDHTTGKGVQVPSAGININANLEFNDYALLEIGYAAFTASAAPSTTKSVYVATSGDLYYYNASGTSVQLTNGGSINAAGSGLLSYSSIGAYPYSVLTTDAQKVLGVDTSAARTLNLPAASNEMAFWVKDEVGTASTYNITVSANGGDTIDGASSWTLNEDWGARMFISDGTSSWAVL